MEATQTSLINPDKAFSCRAIIKIFTVVEAANILNTLMQQLCVVPEA
ncbi:hypothetical protein ACJ2PR_24310 [Phormidesmis sp. 146-33]